MAQDADELFLSSSQRKLAVHGKDLRSLGRQLATVYGDNVFAGLRRAKTYYTEMPPISFTEAQWRQLSDHARQGTRRCCPAASEFFEALEEELGWDVYQCLLDFEVYALESQRQSREDSSDSGIASSSSDSDVEVRRRSGSARSRSSSSSGGDLNAVGINLVDLASALPADSESTGSQKERARPSGRCTGFAALDGESGNGGSVLLAQTVDLPDVLYGFADFDCILQLATDAGHVLVWDTDGRLCPIGLNAAGLGVSVFNLHDTRSEGFEQASVTVQALAWELLLGQHNLASALDLIRSLPAPMMTGCALLLADASGAVTCELNPGGAAVGDVCRDRPVVRANHALLEQSLASFGASKKSRASSERRQEALATQLRKSREYEREASKPLNGAAAMLLLKQAKKVRNSTTLAVIAMDLLQGQLHVEFRERQPIFEEEIKQLAVELNMTPKAVKKVLAKGRLRMDMQRPRLVTGEEAQHLVHWTAHAYAFEHEKRSNGQKSGGN